jgi:hypothetical protein
MQSHNGGKGITNLYHEFHLDSPSIYGNLTIMSITKVSIHPSQMWGFLQMENSRYQDKCEQNRLGLGFLGGEENN